ncbi:hypothetical protein GV819_31540 [Pseudomonas sp. Fl5BN2]|uniref:hypothetical protein n=1 Tax=Pseudomonas sp. Fl5BN2 TaxID=2697652 RepID=UPI001376D75C|nr:hypothetical protein [Pseudomonas sp. Fl5BN2]NBF06810.1 hypothetical protein [Pseudomonas sp. Fl5BN2]
MMGLSEVLSRINDGVFLELIFQENTDWDARLDSRDGIEFASAWSASYEQVLSSCPPEDESIRQVREAAFKKVYQITGNPDLAGYVSDDFGLIVQAFKHQVDSGFIHRLWQAYAQGTFPH